MKKMFKGIIKTYLVVTSTYFTVIFLKISKEQYDKHNHMKKYVKKNKHHIDSINRFSKLLKENGYFDKEV